MNKLHDDIKSRLDALGGVVVIPTYNNERTILQVIDEVRAYASHIIVVNDGCTDKTPELLTQRADIEVITFAANRGKGAALKHALRRATMQGYRYAITIDSDGQHFASDIPVFVDEIEKTPDTLLVGARNLQAENMPSKNTFANKFSNFWFWAETGQRLTDTQSGFRLYPLKKLAGMRFLTPRYEFEVEVIVRAAWRGITVRNVPIHVYYPPENERVSHFRPAKDFTRISLLNTALVLMALLVYYPWKFVRSLTRENIRRFVRKNITQSGESNLCIAASIGLGVTCGILPAWGYQLWIALALAHVAKLNKIIAVAASNVSVPPMIPFILYGSYAVGCALLGNPVTMLFSEATFETVSMNLWQYVLGAIVLALLSGAVVTLCAWFVLSIFRKK